MTNTITVEQLKELLQIQKEFDDRIESKTSLNRYNAYVVEFFEWYNTIEPFKDWKKNKGKPREEQLDELSDMMAFALAHWLLDGNWCDNTQFSHMPKESDLYRFVADEIDLAKEMKFIKERDPNRIDTFSKLSVNQIMKKLENVSLLFVFKIAIEYYSVPELIEAYKKKMQRNHDRQDGKADTDKGYV